MKDQSLTFFDFVQKIFENILRVLYIFEYIISEYCPKITENLIRLSINRLYLYLQIYLQNIVNLTDHQY